MKYMTFNSSCSYAGVANMLAQYGVDTDDRTIAMGMKLPYLFTQEDGIYLAGPMLQIADWFNLYLNPIGFRMRETEVESQQISAYLKRQKTAMLGLQVEGGGKHAVVYTGSLDGKLVFQNNKWASDAAPEQIILTEAELLDRIGTSAMVATLERIPPREVDLPGKLRASIPVIQRNLADIQALCAEEVTVGFLRSKLNTVFRPLLLDGITMLELLGETELAQAFEATQHGLLKALRQDDALKIRLGEYLPMDHLRTAADGYIRLIDQEVRRFK